MEHVASPMGCIQHRKGIRVRTGHRLFRVAMQTRFQHSDGGIRVVVVVEANIDGIQGCAIKQLLKGAVGFRNAKFGCGCCEGFGITVGDGNDFGIRDRCVIQQMLLRNLSASNDSNSNFSSHFSAPEIWQTFGKHFYRNPFRIPTIHKSYPS